MSNFSLIFICIQICLLQNAFSQCIGAGPLAPGYGPAIAPAGLASPYGFGGLPASPFGVAPTAIELAPGYGGTGVGDIAVAGEMPVVGTTLVAGQVPILGSVRFAGDLPAAGTVSISGSCGCGCGGPYYY
ncbi:chorion class CA protein ERA.1-like [Vanessa cardui]|uniref:chorion class CA protein ERA.1-like n=1 Tax=Vanessa cardui TaxID=171605 RepID=UPI001F13E633|nr:chorion class CA protein ERA.1-like [Vanessa cardui]